MILTLTPNPTVDRVVFCRDFRLGGVVRAEGERVIPSGKGVDASLVIHELGGETVVLGLRAGLNGRLHAGLLDRAENLFSRLSQGSRYQVQALESLCRIYEQEKEWEKAIEAGQQLEREQLEPLLRELTDAG